MDQKLIRKIITVLLISVISLTLYYDLDYHVLGAKKIKWGIMLSYFLDRFQMNCFFWCEKTAIKSSSSIAIKLEVESRPLNIIEYYKFITLKKLRQKITLSS